MTSLNPNHPTSQKMSDQWYKIVGILLLKLELKEVIITVEDILLMKDGLAIVVDEQPDGLHIRLTNMNEAHRLARQHGGLPT